MDASLPHNHYRTLNIPIDADLATIRSAHRKLLLSCHPDRVQDESEKEQRAMQLHQVQQAYEVLSNDNRRRQYDQVIQQTKLREDYLRRLPPRPKAHKSTIPDLETPEVNYQLKDSERPDRPYYVSRYSAHSPNHHSD